MAESYASVIVAVPSDRVWPVLRDFGSLPWWHPGIDACVLESDRPPTELGCVRALTLADGANVRERLTAMDDSAGSYSYEMLHGPFPIRTYRATMRLAPVTATDETFVEWYAHYDAEEADEANLDHVFASDVFAAGLAGLSRYCTG